MGVGWSEGFCGGMRRLCKGLEEVELVVVVVAAVVWLVEYSLV